MEGLPESNQTIVYTRFVLEKGVVGDLLDLHVALAPADKSNKYSAWIDMYASEDCGRRN